MAAGKAVAGGKVIRPLQVFRQIGPQFAQTLETLKPGARITKAAAHEASLIQPAEPAMRILLPKGYRADLTNDLGVRLYEDATLRYEGKDDVGHHVFRAVHGKAQPKLTAIEARPKGAPLLGMADGSHPDTISPRNLSAMRSRAAAAGRYMPINIEAMRNPHFVELTGKTPEQVEKIQDERKVSFAHKMRLFRKRSLYPQFRAAELPSDDPEKIVKVVKARLKSNIRFMYDAATPQEREARTWYPAARKLVDEEVRKHGINDATAAGVFAALSPQAEWEHNIAMGQRLIDIYKNKQDCAWNGDDKNANDRKMSKAVKEINAISPALRNKIEGKSLKDLTDPVEQAAWIRTYDLAYNDRSFRTFNMDGTLGDFVTNMDGSRSKLRWQTTDNIVKAIKILKSNGDRSVISSTLGNLHKVRSFYNNMLDPTSDNEDLTSDTHAIGAALMQPYSGPDTQVVQGLGTGGAGKSTVSGVAGLYGVYADAYREVAHEVGLRPNELQAIVWTVKRNTLFSADMADADIKHVDTLWREYSRGNASLEDTQKAIMAFGRGLQRQREERKIALREKRLAKAKQAVTPEDTNITPTERPLGHGYSKRSRLLGDTVHTSDVRDAARALYENRKVVLTQTQQVSTLLDHLGQVAKTFEKMGRKAPTFNLCNVSVRNTNLFCAENKGIPRVKMPQFTEQGTLDFIQTLRDKGYRIDKQTALAAHLRATQNELQGAKVAANMAKMRADPSLKGRHIVVSKDDYILDGHHHWAAAIGIDAADGNLTNDKEMNISRIDIDIISLLKEARDYEARIKKAA